MARILVIDDEALICEMLRDTLIAAGHDVYTASDGEEGLRSQESQPADVVVTDIFMPEKEGLETIVELRRTYPNVKIIAISGGSPIQNADVLQWARECGADLAFQKPLERVEILRAVEECLGTGGVE